MKNIVRASIFGTFTVVAFAGTVSCWPTAPISGGEADAAIPSIKDASGITLPDGIAPSDATLDADDAGDSSDATVPLPPVLPYATPLVATGIGFGCRIDQATGNVFCWGDNSFWQGGNPVDAGVPDVGDAGDVDGGEAGDSSDGGDGSAPDSGSPPGYHQVAGISNATALALGDYHACAISASKVYCWGLNNAYQLGHAPAETSSFDQNCTLPDAAETTCNAVPEAVEMDASAVGIAAAGAWTCALATDGSIQCWGAIQTTSDPLDPALGATVSTACGTGTASHGGYCYPSPYPVPGVTGVTQLAVAFDHACTIMSGNQLACWGSNTQGQTASTTACPNNDCASPLLGAGLPISGSAAVGTYFTCALGAGGTVSCFGDNMYGELGPTDLGATARKPVTVPGLGFASELVAGGSQPGTQVACAIVNPLPDGGSGGDGGADSGTEGGIDSGPPLPPPITGGTVMCWGAIAGDAGPGVPVTIRGLPTMNALGVPGDKTECGIAVDGTIWCWDLATGTAPVMIP